MSKKPDKVKNEGRDDFDALADQLNIPRPTEQDGYPTLSFGWTTSITCSDANQSTQTIISADYPYEDEFTFQLITGDGNSFTPSGPDVNNDTINKKFQRKTNAAPRLIELLSDNLGNEIANLVRCNLELTKKGSDGKRLIFLDNRLLVEESFPLYTAVINMFPKVLDILILQLRKGQSS